MDKRTAFAHVLFDINIGESRTDDEACTGFLCLSWTASWTGEAKGSAPVQWAANAPGKDRAPQCPVRGGVSGGIRGREPASLLCRSQRR
jgi:hypothetical protein